MPPFVDKQLQCTRCGNVFVSSAGEQELLRLRGISRQPESCAPCLRLTAGQRLRKPA